jgi:sugar phosphate permease
MVGADTAAAASKVPRRRWQVPMVLLVSVLIAYFDRMNISYALPKIAQDYGWSVAEIGKYGGLLMSIFYVGYGLANILLSPIGERFGPRRSLMVIVVLFSIFTMLSAPLGLIFSALVAVRICLGVSEGIHFPMMNALTKRWFPVHERSRANGLWVCGLFLSMILAPFIVVPIIDHWGWQAMFYVLGIAGIVVTIPLIYAFVYDSPREHPAISAVEIDYIESGSEAQEAEAATFWSGVAGFLKKKEYWVALLGGIFSNMVAFGLLNWLPTYFTEGRGLEFSKLTYATSIPYAFSVIGVLLWSFLGDKTDKRAVIAGLGFFGAGIVAYFAATAATIGMVVVLFALTIFIKVTYAANEFAIIQRILPRSQVGTGVGLYNGLAMMIGGGLGPVLVGGVVSATGDYTMGILSLTVLAALGGITMLILGWLTKY